ncbi:MAG: PAS domain S-box protein [Promethearchaeota archaeon]|nr:MAG: PAS domain S-box protein [Candidatus Lokiarchaeota archaeon]
MLYDDQKKSASIAHKETEAILRTAIECLPFDVFMINKKGYYIMQNSTCKEHWGDVLGKRPEIVANNEDTLKIWETNNKRAFSGETVTGEVSFELNGEVHYFYNIISPVYIENVIQYIIGINIEITENKEAKRKLRESENKYQEMIENLDFGFFQVSLDGTILTHNRKYNEIFGIDPLKCLNGEKTINYWKNKNDRQKFILELKKNGRVKNYIATAKKINGETIILQENSHLIYDNKGVPIASEGTIIDITEKYNLERNLEDSEKRYRDIAELLPDVIFETDLNLNLTYVNSIAFKKFGYTKEDLSSGLNINLFVEKTYRELASKNIRLIFQGKDTTPQEYLLVKKDGTKFYGLVHSRPIYKDKKIIGIRGTITDINNLVMAEKELKESEVKFRRIFESIPDIFFLLSEDSTILDYAGKKEDLYIPPEEFIGKRMSEILPSKIGLLVDEYIENTLKTQKPHYLEYSLPLKNETRLYEARFLYFSKSSIAVFIRDITTRKQIEQKLISSEEKYRKLFENSPIGLMEQDFSELKRYIEDLKASGINDFEKYLTDNPKEVFKFISKVKVIDVNRKVLEIYKAKSKKSFILGINKLSENNNGMSEEIFLDNKMELLSLIKGNLIYESVIATKTNTGDKIHLHAKTSVVPGFENTWSKVIVSLTDITKRKVTEQKLMESEEKYRHLYESSPYSIILINMEGIIIDCNLSSEKLSGFNKNELIGMNFAHSNFIPKEHIYVVVKDFKTLLKNEVLEPREIELFTHEKKHVWVSYQASICTIENEKIIQVIIEDISKRKKVEENLKESEAKYHKLFETSPDAVILTNLNGTILEANSALENIFGYSPQEFIGENFMDLEIYYENALDILLKGYEDLLNMNYLEAVELPIKTKYNTINWVQLKATLINMKGKQCILVVIHDISNLKETEEVIRKNEAKFRDILETSSVGVMEFDVINKKLLYINPKLLNIIGFEKDEITEELIRNHIIHPRDLVKLLKTFEEQDLEFRVKDKQNKVKWLAGKRIPHYKENGEIESIRIWLDDITEKKMYENLIYELNINFLNFTADIRNNINLLLNTCLKLLDGNMILYIHKLKSEDRESYQIITPNDTYNYNQYAFDKLFIKILFNEEHDFPQTFFDIDRMIYATSDPFIIENKFKGSFGKVIKSHEGLNSAVCIFYKNNPIISGQDKLVLFLICDAIEIEQRRWQVQQDLEKQNITLNKINKLKSELFSRTSHELKTPLISVKGFTELLLTLYKAKLDPEIISILNEIKDGSKRLEKIINLLLDSTKLEAGQLSLNLQDEDLTFLIKFCVRELQGLAKLRNQSISLNLSDEMKTKFDKERIYEVFSNLLVNAIKYTPPDGNITINSKTYDNVYEVSIKDNGIGFTEDEKSLIFKQFGKIERYGQGWDIAADGTGLGLYITKKLVELHGGKIWFESEGRNKGTTFYFTIPIKK